MQTTYLPRTLINRHGEFLGLKFSSGRADSAPTLDSIEGNLWHVRCSLPQDMLKHLDVANGLEAQKDYYLANLEAARKDWDATLMDMPGTKAVAVAGGEEDRQGVPYEDCGECARLRWVDLDASLCCRGCSGRGSRGTWSTAPTGIPP